MALVADFMLVWLPAPTIPLRPALAISVGPVARFFYACPDNAFQIALAGTNYSLIQRAGALVRNGAKLFDVGASASVGFEAIYHLNKYIQGLILKRIFMKHFNAVTRLLTNLQWQQLGIRFVT
ncbi:protein RETICULATA-RELATED 4, chloroplastic-like isoform X3 [Silene latifolia]|uniref:protein RETICULATA-RELATED 4, chloroplastic-like isoform X3 n=1 Tax=Silene latifolia TaxID=37657 RepID=UPI003D780314